MLALFPSGDVARMDWRGGGIVDPPWNPSVAHLIRMAECAALPVYFRGSNGLGFQLIGALHPRLRTADLPRQTLNKRGQSIEVRIGRVVAAKALKSFGGEREAIEYLRFRTFLLAGRRQPQDSGLVRFPIVFPRKRSLPVAAETATSPVCGPRASSSTRVSRRLSKRTSRRRRRSNSPSIGHWQAMPGVR